MDVTCGECGHPATISASSDAWKCNCVAEIGPDPECRCDATNYADGSEDNPPDTTRPEIRDLEARLVELRGQSAPSGEVDL